jgi:hypothetical protein
VLRLLVPLLIILVTVYAVVECIQTEESQVRNLHKLIWILLIVIAPPVGAIAWLIAGRPQSILPGGGPGGHGPGGPGAGTTGRGRPSAPRGPEDDPDIQRGL